MPLLHHIPNPTDFTSTIKLLNVQYIQIGTWISFINTKLQICTPNEKYELYQTLYLLDTFQSNLADLRIIVQARTQIGRDKTQPEEPYKNLSNFTQIPTKLTARPSVLDQLTTFTTRHQSSNTNYYAPLYIGTMTSATSNNIVNSNSNHPTTRSSLLRAAKQPASSVNVVSLKELGAIIDEFTTNTETVVPAPPTPSPDTMDTRYGIRLQLQVSGFNKNTELFVKLDKFMTAAKQADYTLSICPFQQENPDKLPNINACTELQHARDLTKYFRSTGPNQMWSLNGQILVESQFTSETLLEHLNIWCKNGNHRVSPLQCQTEETSQLGFLIRSSVTIFRDDLKMAIKQHPLWVHYGSFEFGLTVRLLHSPKLSVPTLCIEVGKSQAAQAADFFTKVYDGEYDELPLGLNFLFFSTFNCAASDSDRSTLAQEQDRFLSSERTITIKGLHPLDTKVRLATPGNPPVTIRSLLLLIPTTSLTPLFHGIDRQHGPAVPFILAKYPEHHAEELIKSIPNMDATIKVRTHHEDHQHIFIDVNEGLTFGAEFQNYKNKRVLRTPFHLPSNASRLHLTNILQKINSTATKRVATTPGISRPATKKQAWKNVSFSSTATTSTNTSSIATNDTNTSSIDPPNDPIILTFETKLSDLQLSHNATNARIDELDTNLSIRIDSLDNSIQSFVLTSNKNFGLLFAHFNVSSTTNDNSPNSPNLSLSPPILEDMEIDTDSRKRDRTPRSGIARQNAKK